MPWAITTNQLYFLLSGKKGRFWKICVRLHKFSSLYHTNLIDVDPIASLWCLLTRIPLDHLAMLSFAHLHMSGSCTNLANFCQICQICQFCQNHQNLRKCLASLSFGHLHKCGSLANLAKIFQTCQICQFCQNHQICQHVWLCWVSLICMHKFGEFDGILSNLSNLPFSPNLPTCLASLSFGYHKPWQVAFFKKKIFATEITKPRAPSNPSFSQKNYFKIFKCARFILINVIWNRFLFPQDCYKPIRGCQQ